MKKMTNEQFIRNFTIIQIDGETKDEMMRDATEKVDDIIKNKLDEYKDKALAGNAAYIAMYNTLMSNRRSKRDKLLRFISRELDSELEEVKTSRVLD